MSRDIHVIIEFKKDGKWHGLGRDTNYCGFEFWDTDMYLNTLLPLIFCRDIVCGWYEDEKIPYIRECANGEPNDLSKEVIESYEWGMNSIAGFITSKEVEEFDWNFKIPYRVQASKQDADEFYNTGKIPTRWATCMTDGVRIKFTEDFVKEYQWFFKEIGYFKTLGEDYRILYYFS